MRSSIVLCLCAITPTTAFTIRHRSLIVQPRTDLISLYAYAYSPQLDVGYMEYEDLQKPMPPILSYANNDPYDNLLQRMRLPDAENSESVVKKLEDRLEALTKSLRDSSIVQYLDTDSYTDHHKNIERDTSLFDRDVENRLALPNKKIGSLVRTEPDYFIPDIDTSFMSRIEPGYYTPNLPSQIFSKKAPMKIQGGSLQTWTFNSVAVKAAHIVMKTDGRPLDADIELWQGPDNTPCKMRVYVEDGAQRYFSAMIATPRGSNTVALRNIGMVEFPLEAQVVADTSDIEHPSTDMNVFTDEPTLIQGGALRIFEFEASVNSIQILLNTDGRPLNARVELLQGPNNIKQLVELYAEDGLDRPFLMIIETPGSGNAVRIVNTSPIEFPLTAGVEAYEINEEYSEFEPVIGGDTIDGFLSFAKSYF